MSVFAFKNAIFYFWKETHLIWQLGYSILTAMIIRESDQRNKWRWQKRWGDFHTFFSKCPGYCHHIGKQKWPQCAIHASPLSCQVLSPIIIRRLEWQNEIWKVTTHKNVAKSDHLCCWCPDILFCQWFWNSCQTDNGLRLGFIISLLPDIHDLQCHLVWSLTEKERMYHNYNLIWVIWTIRYAFQWRI